MSFKIETVKWSWAEAVKNKEVYRDYELIRTKTKEEALNAINFLMGQPKGLTYTITVYQDGEYLTYFMHSMPCLGGLVKYRDTHGKKFSMNPYHPRDIRVAFPEGDIIYIGCYRQNAKLNTPYYEFVFSEKSPWKAAFGSKDTIIFKDNYFVLTNMDADPTVFYSLMRLGGFAYYGVYGAYGALNKNLHPKVEILLKSTHADPRRLAGQKPIKTSGGTWAEGFGYTRPYNESIFKTSLPHKLKDFGKLAGYPNAPYTNEYFVSEMKNKFRVNISTNLYNSKIDKKTQEILIEAWDYFKEKANKLEE